MKRSDSETQRLLLIVCGFLLILQACGYVGEKGKEPRGDTNLPVSGVGKFEKQDYYCNTQLVQPFLVEDPTSSTKRSGEPWLLNDEGVIRVWYVVTDSANPFSTLFTAQVALSPGTECRKVDAALVNIHEITFTPAPSFLIDGPTVIKQDGRYRMWFEKGQWDGIGYAESADGIAWDLVSENTIEPNQEWEKGSVGSPSVLWVDGTYRMWYEGNVFANRAVGYAWSENGREWSKSDASGLNEPGTGQTAGNVRPVLEATQNNWEFWHPGDPWGRVGQPCVILHETPLRRLFYMYYVGNMSGRLDPANVAKADLVPDCFLFGCFDEGKCMDASIGLASSEDGLQWEKAASFSEPDVIANEINPIMNEKFPVSVDPRKLEGSINVFCPNFIVHEAEPAVVEVVPNQLFIMLWHQADYMNLVEGQSLPPEDPSKPSKFKGASGIGFAYVGNLNF